MRTVSCLQRNFKEKKKTEGRAGGREGGRKEEREEGGREERRKDGIQKHRRKIIMYDQVVAIGSGMDISIK